MAAFRIACGVCTIGWTVELWPLCDYLFTSDGLFLRDAARQVFAASTFAGIADGSAPGEPAGAIDSIAIVQLIASPRQSVLFFWDDASAVRIHLLVLLGAALCLTLGIGTAVTKWITLIAFHSLAMRNSIFWAGEQVFWWFMLPLCLSRCGQAWSIDAILRRRLGRAPSDDFIPGWPRVLALLQTIPLFTANGLAKSGQMWAEGDTFHYLLMHPDFHRFDPTALAEIGSTTIFRVMTWGAHAFELLYPLAIVGVVVRFRSDERIPPLAGWRARAARIAWIAVALGVATLGLLAYEGRERVTLCFAAVMLAAVVIAALAIAGDRAANLSHRVARRVLHRRIWVGLIAIFTANLALLASLGWFVLLTMATTILFFGRERPVPRAPMLDEPTRWLALAVLSAGAFTAFALASALAWTMTLVCVGIALAVRVRTADARGRLVVGWFCAFHVAGMAVILLPSADLRTEGRHAIEDPFRRWEAYAPVGQSWRMFAPDGPRTVDSVDIEVTRSAGETIAIGNGLPEAGFPSDKLEKIERRIANGEGRGTWYRKWHGRYVCRHWTTIHGEPPEEVTMWRVRRPIAAPEIYAHGDPRDVEIEAREIVWQQRCHNEVHAQPTGSPAFVPWIKRRGPAWAQLREEGGVPELPWPLAILAAPAIVLAVRQRRPNQDRGTP